MQLPITQLGNRRQKKTRSSIIEQLAQQAAQKRNLGKFAKLGQGRGSRSSNPFGSGGRFGALRGTGRPQMLGHRGMGRSGEMMEALFGGAAPAIHTTQAATPTDYLGGPETPGPGGQGGGLFAPPPASSVGDPRFDPNAPTNQGGTTMEDYAQQRNAAGGTGADVLFTGGADWAPVDQMLQQGGTPASPGMVGGMIPLGGGLYLNPSTGQIMGGGLGNRGLTA